MTNRSSSALTRRGFLKGAGAAAGALGLAGAAGMVSSDSWLSPATATAESDERIAYTYHQSHCGSMCPLKCTVRDGRLVMVQPNDACEDRYRTICLKGISEIQHIYSSKRVQVPLKRAGERGTNDFVQVTWDEALDDIVARIKDIQAKHGKDSVMVTTGAEADVPFLAAILGARTGGNTGIDVGTGNGLDPATGTGWGYAMSAPEARDWVDSRLVLTVGSNFCESSLTTSRLLFEAKEAGARTVTVDPHFSTTAGKSDEWVPIEPGTDAALFLGMITHILENDLVDSEFMRMHTSLPFLVDKKTGKIVMSGAPVMDELTAALVPGQKNLFWVIDGSGEVAPFDEADAPRLSGTVEVDGVEACTVYDLLLENQKAYTLAWASEITGIPQKKIAELAELYAEGPSSLAFGWGGNDKMSNADIAGHAAAVLVAITGNIVKKGAGVGVYVGGAYNGYAATLGAWALPATMTAAAAKDPMYDLPAGKGNVHAHIACGDKLAQCMANMSKSEKWARSLDLIVTVDSYFTEAAKWADYVLPMTTRFEYDEDFGNIKNGYSHIVMQEKVLDPLFEAKTDLWFQREIARRLGVEDALPKTARECVDAILSTSTDPYINSLTVEKIADNQGVWPCAGIEEVRRVIPDYAFPTLSGGMDVYYEELIEFGQALPVWEPCVEATRDNALRSTYPLQLSNVRTRFRIHNQFNDAAWLEQLYRPTIDVNPVDMKARGLETGDAVEVKNDRGSFKVYVHANEAIRPGSARMYEAATADYTIEGNMQSVTNDTLIERGRVLMVGPVIPFSDTLVEIEKA